MNNMVLGAYNLAKTYYDGANQIEVLRDVNLEVKPGELVAIVGNSGCGKSTLLHLLGGLDKPSAGKVIIAGKNLSTLTENEKCDLRNRYLGFVYQFHHLLPEFTAIENVGMPLLIGKHSSKVIQEKSAYLLELVGLQNRLQHKIGELSGGERQRVAIARALVTDPVCVLADEPTGNLDPGNAQKVLQLFIALQKSRKTSVIMVTHDINVAKQAGRVLIVEGGKLSGHCSST